MRALVFLAFTAAALGTAAAQSSVVVRDSVDGRPVAGAVVMLQDNGGATLARSISNQAGVVALAFPTGAARVRVIRMGYRPLNMRVTSMPSELRVVRLPNLLDEVQVVDRSRCPRDTRSASAFALWEQARAGLLASVVAGEVEAPMLRRVMSYRLPAQDEPGSIAQIVRRDSSAGHASFTATRNATAFVQRGFVSDSAGRIIYMAPDADALLSDAFTEGYCFRLETDEVRRGYVGLAFRPARRSSDRVDIEGIVWVDTAARSLSDLEFDFLGIGGTSEATRSGGKVAFTLMPNGRTLISQWSLRIASGGDNRGPSRRRPLTIAGDNVPLPPSPSAFEIRETRGYLSQARFADGTAWSAPLASIRGRLSAEGAGVPAGAVVRLIGTDYTATVDSTGAFVIGELVPGSYHLALVNRALNSLGLELTTGQRITVAGGDTIAVDMRQPRVTDFISAKCPGSAPGTLALVGRVLNTDQTPAPNVRVSVWRSTEVTIRPGMTAVPPVQSDDWKHVRNAVTATHGRFLSPWDGEIGDRGLFVVCDIPSQSLLRVEAHEGGHTAQARLITPPDRPPLFLVQLRLEPR